MKVVVDTSVWSLALRRKKETESEYVEVLKELIIEGRVVLLGAIRQEILSGIRYVEQYEKLKTELRSFPNLQTNNEDYEIAASFYNKCRQKGVQGSNTDYLICAVASQRNHEILTTDRDFDNFLPHLPIKLLKPNNRK